MNTYLRVGICYITLVDFDKNTSTGETLTISNSDIGREFYMYAEIQNTPFYSINFGLDIVYGSFYGVKYNMTAGNCTAYDFDPDPSIAPLFQLSYLNTSQAEVVYGVNWTWLTGQLALAGSEGDNCSMYFEFVGRWDHSSDWCPDRTGYPTDYLEWNPCGGGIPGFSMALALLSLLTFLGATILLHRNRLKL